MTDIALTLPAGRQHRSFAKAGLLLATLRSTCTYAAFGLSVAFSLAVVLGIVH
jgi:ABC-type nitrate/sulfonate/bicarbonate transport system permease component